MKLTLADAARLFGPRLYRFARTQDAAPTAQAAPTAAAPRADVPPAAPQPTAAAQPEPAPAAAAPSPWQGPADARLGILITAGDLASERELLEKILQALDLSLSQVRVWTTEAAPLHLPEAPPTVLSFGLLVPQALALPSLRAMAADVNLKRQAWEKLKPLREAR